MTELSRRAFLVASGAAASIVMLPRNARGLVPPVLSVGTVTSTSVQLNWTDAGDENIYRVRRGTTVCPTGNQSNIIELAANTLTYTNTGLQPNTTYRYVVVARRGTTVASNCVAVTTLAGTGMGGFPSYAVGYAA